MSDAVALPPPPPPEEIVVEEEPHVPTRRLLAFNLGGGTFACDMDVFREIVPTQQITRLPGAPDTVCGLINLRGTIVTVIDGGVALGKRAYSRAEGLILLEENLHATVKASDSANVLDLVYTLTPLSDITVSRWAFSGFCLRVRKDAELAFHSPKGIVTLPNPSHLKPESDWPDAPWYACSLKSKDGTVFGAAVINHPKNPPTLWHNHRDVRMINRQPNSGTRLELDQLLREAGIDSGLIAGYDTFEFTHLAVAATIAFPGIAVYSATKSAVDRLTRVAAMESGKLGYGVRVNCIYPGLVPTEMGMKLAADVVAAGLFPSPEAAVGAIIEQTPAGRLGEVADMADAVVFLCSDASRFITGAGLPVDGGMGM